MSDRLEQLSTIDLFSGLKPVALELLAQVVNEESHAEGSWIFRQGDPGDKLYLILQGRVRISRDTSGGEEAVAVLGAGQAFGELALIDESPRSADARAHEACRFLVVPKEELGDLLVLHKDLAFEVLWNVVRLLASRLRETTDKLTLLSLTSRF